MSATILLVEDDIPTRRAVALYLEGHGYVVDEAADGAAALREWDRTRPDLVVVDLGLPDIDGLRVIEAIRLFDPRPILVLTGRHQEREKVRALDLGADDYVTKPFGMEELHARIRALLRRASLPTSSEETTATVGPLTLDSARHEARIGDEPVHLTPREFEVLRVLVQHAGRVVTHTTLLRTVWGPEYDAEGHYVHVYVSQIRRKLVEAGHDEKLRDLISAEPGVGYRIRIPE